MMQSITSYLWGDASEEILEVSPNMTLKMTPADGNEDWLIVDKDNSREGSMERGSSPIPCPCQHSHQNSPIIEEDNDSNSDISTVPDCNCQESWLVTPPPCFQSGGYSPDGMVVTELENKLIESPVIPSFMFNDITNRIENDTSEEELSEEEDIEQVAGHRRHPRAVNNQVLCIPGSIKKNMVMCKISNSRAACRRSNSVRFQKRGKMAPQQRRFIQPVSRSFSKRC